MLSTTKTPRAGGCSPGAGQAAAKNAPSPRPASSDTPSVRRSLPAPRPPGYAEGAACTTDGRRPLHEVASRTCPGQEALAFSGFDADAGAAGAGFAAS
jgi:hypothetical protein